jgi:hypothetical protein
VGARALGASASEVWKKTLDPKQQCVEMSQLLINQGRVKS